MHKWDKNLNHAFVEKYGELEVLWNIDHPLRRKASEREKAYATLQKLVNIPEFTIDDVKRKIKGFRTTYCIELKKIQESKDSSYEPCLSWFHIMDKKLRGTSIQNMQKVRTAIKIHPPPLKNRKTKILKHLQRKKETKIKAEMKRELIDCDDSGDDLQEFNEDAISNYNISDFAKLKRTMGATDIPSNQSIIVDTLPQPTREDEDEFDLFGKSIAIQLRKMPLNQALKLQLEIQTLLINSRIQINSNNE